MGGMGMGGGLNRSGLGGARTMPVPEVRGGLELGPSGRWWDNKELARHVGLDANQQHRMDDVFNANRDNLLKLYKGVKHEEAVLQKMTRSKELDENQIFQQIDRVTMARGELEKATAHYMLQIRREMTPDQTQRLDSELQPPDGQ
jgi:Spy/CpxP family protein refolding chaperone